MRLHVYKKLNPLKDKQGKDKSKKGSSIKEQSSFNLRRKMALNSRNIATSLLGKRNRIEFHQQLSEE